MTERRAARGSRGFPPAPAAALCYGALVLFLTGDVLFSKRHVIFGAAEADAVTHTLPWRAFGFSELRQGRLALWNPHVFSGAPYFGEFEAGLLYPLNWLHLFLPPAPAINWIAALHLWLAGIFMFLWCRFRGGGRLGSFLAGLCFMFCGPVFLCLYAGHLPKLCVMAWAPLVFLCADGWLRTGDKRWLLRGMLAAAMQILAGFPQMAYYTALIAAAYACLHLKARRDWIKPAGVGSFWAGGGLLAAVQVLAGLAANRECVRSGGLSLSYAGSFSLPPENLLTFLSPFFFGDRLFVPYFGQNYLWEACLFMGCAGLLLAVFGLQGERKPERRICLTLLFLILILAFGAHVPPVFRGLYHTLPGYAYFRGTSKFGFFAALFLCVYVGPGWDRLGRPGGPARRFAWPAAALALLCLGMAAAVERSSASGLAGKWGAALARLERAQDRMEAPLLAPAGPHAVEALGRFSAGELRSSGWIFLGAAALLAAAGFAPFARYGLAALLVAELLGFARVLRVATPVPRLPSAQSREVLEKDRGDYRVLARAPYALNLGMQEGYQNIWGYSPFVAKRYAEFLFFTQGRRPSDDVASLRIENIHKLFRLLRLRYVFPENPGGPVETVPAPMPRLLLIRDWKILHGRDLLFKEMAGPGFNPERTVLLEESPEPPGPASAAVPAGEKVSILNSSAGMLEAAVDLPSPAVLLMTDPYAAGWRVRSLSTAGPQKEYRLLPADYFLRGVPLGAGSHRLRIEYSPLLFRIGRILSVAAWLAYLGLWLRRLASRREQAP